MPHFRSGNVQTIDKGTNVAQMRAKVTAVLAGLAVVMLVAGCSREKIDWKSAEAADTLESYDRFIERHPDSPLADQARARVAQLAEDKDWKRATATDTAESYRQFLAQHANGKWAEEARIRIESSTLEGNPSPLTASKEAAVPPNAASPSMTPAPSGNTTRAAPPAPAPAPVPASKPAPVAAPAARGAASDAASPGYGIQLGAFSSQAAALSAWKKLQVTYDSQLHGLFAHAVPVQTTSGQLFRLQSPVGEESRARSICASMAQQSQPCVVVLPDTHEARQP